MRGLPLAQMNFPEAEPKGRCLYHMGGCDASTDKELVEKGWLPIDLRSIDASDMAGRTRAVLATLEAIRLGTVLASRECLRALELEARICGLLVSKGMVEDKQGLSDEAVESLLDFGR